MRYSIVFLRSSTLSLFTISPTTLQVPVLIIGSHELRGSIEPLAQPFCILEKQVLEKEDDDDDDVDPKSKNVSSSSSCYHVRGIIDRKLLFRQYPKTLIR
jgi:hypothetical protein